uniref:Ig-like domain-containing protein n=1 Tax=Salmo trutta TaxID=8032 RepID=A0A674BE87_SALTR
MLSKEQTSLSPATTRATLIIYNGTVNTPDPDQNVFFGSYQPTKCTGDNVKQQPGGVIVTEGGLVTLSCQYNTSANNAYLYWYKQEANDFPKHMLSRYSFGSGDNAAGFKERFDARLDADSKSVPLTIQRLQVSDSAVYYCALQPTVRGNLCTLYKNLEKKTDIP